MNDRQENKLSMYLAVREVMTDNQALTAGVPAIGAATTALGAEITIIQSLAQTQKQPTQGATQSKRQLRGAMADSAVPVAGAVKALASATNNPELAAEADFTRIDFTSGRDTESASRADIVLALGTANLAALAGYGIVQATLNGLTDAIQAYRNSITRPREVITVTSAATAQLDPAFARADAILKERLDGLMEQFRLTQPAFYFAFQAAREIIDGGGSTPPTTPPTP